MNYWLNSNHFLLITPNPIFPLKIKQRKSIFEITFRGLIFIIFGTIFILAIIAPVIQTIYGFPKGENIYKLLSPICHQYPTRSLWILERPFALCARCFGGYIGLSFSAMLLVSKSKYINRAGIGLLLTFPGIIDGIYQAITNYESSNVIRFTTGLIGGIGLFLIINPFKIKQRRNE